MNNAPVRVGVVGCGDVLRWYVQEAAHLRASGELVLVVAAARTERARTIVTDAFGIPEFTTSSQSVVERDDVDLVLILTPMESHGEIAAAALRAGKHVVVEKPLAVDPQTARELLALARANDRVLVAAPVTTLSPTYRAVERLVRAGEIGRVLSARWTFGHRGPAWSSWFYGPHAGVVFDLAVYGVTTLSGLLGPVRRVACLATTAIPEREFDGETVAVTAEDNAHLVLDFGDGALATVTTGFIMPVVHGPGVELYGERGAVAFLGHDFLPRGYEIWRESTSGWTTVPLDEDWHWASGLGHAVECVMQGTEPLCSPEHAVHVLDVLVAARAAAGDGVARAVPPPPPDQPRRKGTA